MKNYFFKLSRILKKIKKIFFILLIIFLFPTCRIAFANYPVKTVVVDHGHIQYYQIGKGAPLVLLHGLLANKEQWLGVVNALIKTDPNITEKYQFIIPDLPGYGHSNDYPIIAYNLDNAGITGEEPNQISILHHFLQKIGIKQSIRLAGNSMGGLIMTLYTIHYPKEVSSLTFFGSPAGIADFTNEFIDTSFRQGYNPFTPTTVAQFKQMIHLLVFNEKAIMPTDERIESKIIPLITQNYQRYTAAFNAINIPYYRNYLKKSLPITQTVLVLWGNQDRVFGDSAHAKALCKNFNHARACEWHILANAGHVLLKENTQTLTTAAKYFIHFLNQK